MAAAPLVACRSCKRAIADEFSFCPHCGARLRRRWWGLLLLAGAGLVGLFLLVRFVPVSEKRGGSEPAAGKATEPTETRAAGYTVLSEKVSEEPEKTLVALTILVSANHSSRESLEGLLNGLYQQTKNRGGFKHHPHPTHIFIYAYADEQRANAGANQWIARLLKYPLQRHCGPLVNYVCDRPKITLNDRQLAHMGRPPEEKFGLSEPRRIQIWQDLVTAGERAEEEAEKAHPLPEPSTPDYLKLTQARLDRRSDLQEQLAEKYSLEAGKRYGLTQDQVKAIRLEGFQKDWPMPAH